MNNVECLVSISSSESNHEEKVNVFNDVEKNIIFYIEKDKTTNTFDYKNNILKRDNEEMSLEFNFKLNEKTINNIYIKELNNTMTVELITKEIIKEEKLLKIEYEMNNNSFVYPL